MDEAFQQIIANDQAVRRNDDPEGVHQMRIGFRRYLATLYQSLLYIRRIIWSTGLTIGEAMQLGPLSELMA